MIIVAIVHSQGYVLNKKFYVLEFAYSDVTGYRKVFLINSPKSYLELKKECPKLPINVLVTNKNGIPYSHVLLFLKMRYENLSKMFLDKKIVFGYKGQSYQHDVLINAGIPSIINIENFNVPSINKLKKMYSNYRRPCPYHVKISDCCTMYIVSLFERFFEENNLKKFKIVEDFLKIWNFHNSSLIRKALS